MANVAKLGLGHLLWQLRHVFKRKQGLKVCLTHRRPKKSAPCCGMRWRPLRKGLFFGGRICRRISSGGAQFLYASLVSPDERQIDGIAAQDLLRFYKWPWWKSRNARRRCRFYCSCRCFVDSGDVTDAQNCGNILAGIAQFAIRAWVLVETSWKVKNLGFDSSWKKHRTNRGCSCLG